MKAFKFFAHFNRIAMQRNEPNKWTIHWRGTCYPATNIEFNVPVHTVFRPYGRQPRARLIGMAVNLETCKDGLIKVT
jgi:hypothetical protein